MEIPNLKHRVEARLRQWVRRRQPGERLPSVRDLMARWRVSAATLRAAQSTLIAEGLIDVRHGSGAYVKSPPDNRWVAVVTELDLLHSGVGRYHREVARHVMAGLADRGYRAELYLGSSQPGELRQTPSNERFWDDLGHQRIHGTIFLAVPETTAWVSRVAGLSIPAVGAQTEYQPEDHHEAILNQAVALLAERGCRRLALLSWHNKAREYFMRATLSYDDVEICESWMRGDLEPGLRGAGWEGFREIWGGSREKPDGLIVLDDVLFDDAAIAIRELGIAVPEHLQIVTHAVKGMPTHSPLPVTRLEVDPAEDAEWLVRALVARLEGSPVSPYHVSEPTCVTINHPVTQRYTQNTFMVNAPPTGEVK